MQLLDRCKEYKKMVEEFPGFSSEEYIEMFNKNKRSLWKSFLINQACCCKAKRGTSNS